MGKLTDSNVDRQNILNNPYALTEIRKATNINGVIFEDKLVLTKDQVSDFFEIDIRTVERYIEKYNEELVANGYEVLKGKRLKDFKECSDDQFGTDINVGTKTTVLSIFDFRSFLNIGMLLTESEKAKVLRNVILDIVIDVINQKTGGATKYINQRDEDFLNSWFEEENYRKVFTDALKDCLSMGSMKYAVYTNKIYVSIFKEKADEYRSILKLHKKECIRDTLYSEVLDLISAFEYGFAHVLRAEYEQNGRQLSSHEADELYMKFESQPHWKPLMEKARLKMASRDYTFRDAVHLKLEEYITPLKADEFERFLGEKSKELTERLEEAKDVFKRLKERG